MTGPRLSVWLARRMGVGTWDANMVSGWVPIELTPPNLFYGYSGVRGWIGWRIVWLARKMGVSV